MSFGLRNRWRNNRSQMRSLRGCREGPPGGGQPRGPVGGNRAPQARRPSPHPHRCSRVRLTGSSWGGKQQPQHLREAGHVYRKETRVFQAVGPQGAAASSLRFLRQTGWEAIVPAWLRAAAGRVILTAGPVELARRVPEGGKAWDVFCSPCVWEEEGWQA